MGKLKFRKINLPGSLSAIRLDLFEGDAKLHMNSSLDACKATYSFCDQWKITPILLQKRIMK